MIDFTLIWFSTFERWSTLGVISNQMCLELKRRGVPLMLRPWRRNDGTFAVHPDLRDLPIWQGKKEANQRILRLSGADAAGIVYYNMISDNPLTQEQADNLKRAPFVLVPSGFQKRALEETYHMENVRVVHRGSLFDYIERPKRDTYTFLHVGYLHYYKGTHHVINAWKKAFTSPFNKFVRLIFKGPDQRSSACRDHPEIKKMLDELQIADSRVTVINENWDHERMRELYEQADCMVFPFHGIGPSCGKVLLEARKTGMAIIAPRYADVTLWQCPQLLLDDYHIVEKDGKPFEFDYDEEEIALAMEAAWEAEARTLPLKGWTWKEATDELMAVLEAR